MAIAFSFPARSGAQPSSGDDMHAPLTLIPTPMHVSLHEGSFRLKAGDRIVLTRPSDAADRFAAAQLAEEIRLDLNIHVEIGRGVGRILLGLAGKDRAVDNTLRELRIKIPDSLGSQGYILNISPRKILVTANTSTGLFYGVQTLKQIIRGNRDGDEIPCATIVDWPVLEYRGWMDDISRGPIPTIDLLKKQIRTLAEFKLNFFTLYTENVFRLDSFPDIAPLDGITAAEVKELEDYAAPFHVQLIGNFQSFGHQYNTLSHPFYHEMRETENVLSPVAPQTYTYLKKVYSEIVPAYPSQFFNINCDETFELGAGRAKAWVDSAGVGAVYAYHINRVYDLLKPYHKRIMMWGDIADQDTSIVGLIPKDIIMLPWNYSPDKSFDHMIQPFVNEGFHFMVAPGVGCWSEIWPSLGSAVVNISNFVRDGAKYGTMGMLNTAWDDDGENLSNYNWYGFAWGAECSWKPAPPDTGAVSDSLLSARLSNFNNAFDAVFYGSSADSIAQTFFRLDSIRKIPVRGILDDGGFWKDPLHFSPQDAADSNIANNQIAGQAAARVISELEAEKQSADRNENTIDYAIFAARRVRFETDKNIFSIKLEQAIMRGDTAALVSLKSQIDPLLDGLHRLEMDYVRLWQNENRSWWLNNILAKYDRLGNSLLNLDRTVIITPANMLVDGKREISLATVFNDKPIYYTTDGTPPTLGSDLYTGPITIQSSTPIRAGVEEYGQVTETAHEYVLVDKAIGTLYKLESRYSHYDPAYSGGGDSALVDGLLGSTNFHDGRWQAYQGQSLSLILDLKKETSVKEVAIRFLQNSYSWILMPKEVKILFSDDGRIFHEAGDIKNPIDPKLQGTIIHRFAATFDSAKTRFIQVIGVYPGPLPSWHQAAGSPSFMFADEITVK
jgi:hexosaminidase